MGSINAAEPLLHVPVPGIIDIRSDTAGVGLTQLIHAGLKPNNDGEKTLPTLLLYDERGLKLFEKITYLDEYYLTEDEIQVLNKHADEIAERIPSGSMVVELGSGNLRKVKILLDSLDKAGKAVSYYALDLMYSELERTLSAVPDHAFKHVRCYGLWGTYDDGLSWLKKPENASRPRIIMSLGSSIGNFPRREAAEFVAQFAGILKPSDQMIVGVDACQEPTKVYRAYNDRYGITHDFTMNGLRHANDLLGYEAFTPNDWEAIGEYDEAGGRHRAFVIPRKDVIIEGVALRQGEKVRIEESYKYNHEQSTALWADAGVIETSVWTNQDASYGLHMLSKPAGMYATAPRAYAAHPVPSLEEWRGLWAVWDIVTRQMIPDEELYEKPIKLRNACIFYLGHIPTFFDMKLVEATGMKAVEPAYFHNIFERGIDPDVDNPEQCHAHSEIPDTWPELGTILKYQASVRERIQSMYNTGEAFKDSWTGRALWLGFEHEVMHLETLLYMLIQSEKTLPPQGTPEPDFQRLAAEAEKLSVPNQWFDIPEQTITIGLDDPDSPDGPLRHYGWDVEKPAYTTKVPGFKAKARPITNGEYARYLSVTKSQRLPASWIVDPSARPDSAKGQLDGNADLHDFVADKAVRTLFGPVPLRLALHWPVSASYDELSGCAKFMNGRIPTLEEAQSIYEHAAKMKELDVTNSNAQTIPAVNGHLVNDGVEETPPQVPTVNGSSNADIIPDPKKLFVDLADANVGFKHWHPMAVTQNGNKLAGHAEMGGLWEWTSSVLEKRDGFVPMKLYPAYSADFYDDKHNIVLGGSWATHPRFAGRKSVINWYQRNYPFVWAGARLVKDA